MKLELGCGKQPTDGFVHHDRWQHSAHVDLAFDLELLPWPLDDDSVSHLRAIDVFEHLRPWRVEIQQWLDECWRVLEPGGLLEMRLPADNCPYTWRDPTHYRAFTSESFHYWCPNAPGSVWQFFGQYYFGEGYSKWWEYVSVERSAGDWLYMMRKIKLEPEPEPEPEAAIEAGPEVTAVATPAQAPAAAGIDTRS